jgi:hypothetical protein
MDWRTLSRRPRDALYGFNLLVVAMILAVPLSETFAADEGGYVRLRMVEIQDEQGFEQPVVALRFLAPTDWRIDGGVQWNLPVQCQAELSWSRFTSARQFVMAPAPTTSG